MKGHKIKHTDGPPCPGCDQPTRALEAASGRTVQVLYAVVEEDGRYEVLEEGERHGRRLGQKIWTCPSPDCNVEIWELRSD